MHKQTPNSFLVNLPSEYNNSWVIRALPTHRDMELIEKALCKPGFHYLRFEDLATSRETLNTCLQYYNKTVGHLFFTEDLPESVHIDLYSLFLNNDYLPDKLDEFFIDYTHVELLWIERSPMLAVKPWLSMLEKNIIDFNIQKTIPIVIVSYV